MPTAVRRRNSLDRRLSVSLEQRQHDALVKIADKRSLPLAWVVRHACQRLIEEEEAGQLRLPLLDAE
jgi:predicted DNA-binding ribbon-helix-helix protein